METRAGPCAERVARPPPPTPGHEGLDQPLSPSLGRTQSLKQSRGHPRGGLLVRLEGLRQSQAGWPLPPASGGSRTPDCPVPWTRVFSGEVEPRLECSSSGFHLELPG